MASASEVIDLTLSSDDSVHESGYESSDAGPPDIDIGQTAKLKLLVAIGHVPEARLRQVLVKLVQKDPMIEQALMEEFFTVTKRSREVIERWEICANCKEEFDASQDRHKEECTFHTGDMEVNIDFFADHDENCHGPMDTEENRRDFPEGFYWNCCETDGAADGCEKGQHVPNNKRSRI